MSFLISEADRKKIINALSKDASMEIAAIVQYVYHEIMVDGPEAAALSGVWEGVAKEEMDHLEKLAERIDYLGGIPPSKPAPIMMGGNLAKMLQDDIDAERSAIKSYKEHIKLAEEIGDTTTRLMLEEIQSEEEGHAYKFETFARKGIKTK